jgi:tetratricopeptide (TPR) repeat protein
VYPRSYATLSPAYFAEPYLDTAYDGAYYSYSRVRPYYERSYSDVTYPPAAASSVGEATPSQTRGGATLPGSQADTAPLLVQGSVAFSAGRYDEAKQWYVRGVLADDADAYAKILYSFANLATGDFDVAELALRRALADAPDLINDPIDAESLYSDTTRLEAHEEGLTRFVDQHPDQPAGRLLLGYLHFAAGRPREAYAVFDQLATADPQDKLAGALRYSCVRVMQSQKPQP